MGLMTFYPDGFGGLPQAVESSDTTESLEAATESAQGTSEESSDPGDEAITHEAGADSPAPAATQKPRPATTQKPAQKLTAT